MHCSAIYQFKRDAIFTLTMIALILMDFFVYIEGQNHKSFVENINFFTHVHSFQSFWVVMHWKKILWTFSLGWRMGINRMVESTRVLWKVQHSRCTKLLLPFFIVGTQRYGIIQYWISRFHLEFSFMKVL